MLRDLRTPTEDGGESGGGQYGSKADSSHQRKESTLDIAWGSVAHLIHEDHPEDRYDCGANALLVILLLRLGSVGNHKLTSLTFRFCAHISLDLALAIHQLDGFDDRGECEGSYCKIRVNRQCKQHGVAGSVRRRCFESSLCNTNLSISKVWSCIVKARVAAHSTFVYSWKLASTNLPLLFNGKGTGLGRGGVGRPPLVHIFQSSSRTANLL